MRIAAGLDGWRKGWVAVELADGRFLSSFTAPRLSDALARLSKAQTIGVDMPIGFPIAGTRAADVAARAAVGPLRNSVFLVPPRSVLVADTYGAARREAAIVWDRGVTAQVYALRDKILEVEAASDDRLIEVHPEVSFAALAGGPLSHTKRTWNGQQQRLQLLAEASITAPDYLEDAGRVPTDDLLDAAVVAWSADRHARGMSSRLPPDADPRREPVIWY